MDTPFAIKSYNEALILNQQPLTLGAMLENDPSVRTTLGLNLMFYASAGARDTAERGVYQGFQVTNSATGAAFASSPDPTSRATTITRRRRPVCG